MQEHDSTGPQGKAAAANTGAKAGQSEGAEQDPWTEWEPGAQQAQSPQPTEDTAAAPTNASTAAPAAPTQARSNAGAQQDKQGKQDQPATIHKGIYLSALIYVEGDLPPAADFISPATDAVKKALSAVLPINKGGLSISLKSVDVENNVEDTQESKARVHGGSKFQF